MRASKLAFTTQPGGGANGATWTTQPVVTVEDAGGNTITTATNSVIAGHRDPAGHGAPWPAPRNPLAATGGVATFAGCQITGNAGSYTLTASSTGLTTATSTPFSITVGDRPPSSPSRTQPGGGANGAAWTTQPVVTVEDVGGNTVTTRDQLHHPRRRHQTPGGTLGLHRRNPLTATDGVATFAGCKITGKAGTYTLTAGGHRLHDRSPATPSPSPSARPPSWSSPPSPAAGSTGRPGAPSRR